MTRAALLALLLAATANAARADGSPPAHVCLDGRVDREALAAWILDEANLSRRAEDTARLGLSVPAGASVRQAILAAPRLCPPDDGTVVGPQVECAEGDDEAFSDAIVLAEEMLRGAFVGYSIEPGISRVAFFTGSRAEMTCPAPDGPDDETSPTRSDWALNWLRVRGSTESLNIPRGDPALAAETAASLVFSEDGIKDKSSEKITLVAGVPISVPVGSNSHDRYEIVPYFGMVRDITEERGKDDVVTADTFQVGVAFNATIETDLGATEVMRHRISVRPDFLRNNGDTSEVGSLTAAWTPLIRRSRDVSPWFGINAFSRAGDVFGQELLWTPLVDIRAVHGEFLSRGSRTEENSEDFTRLGSRFGLAFSVNGQGWPIDLVLTDTYMAALGDGDALEYLQARLSLALHKDRLFTLDLTYGDGRKSDLDVDEDGWKLSLGAKF